MTRGNQRELARAKNQKKQDQLKKQKGPVVKDGTTQGASLEKRKLRDADIMREKQEKAAAKKEADGASGGASGGK